MIWCGNINPNAQKRSPDTYKVWEAAPRLPRILIKQNNKYSTRPPVHKGGVALET